MKKLIAVLLVFVMLTGCSPILSNTSEGVYNNTSKDVLSSGVWLSFSEISDLLSDETAFKTRFAQVIQNLQSLYINDLYIHVRSHGDSIFKSEYFPINDTVLKYDYDVFEYMINECHRSNIRVHAWINPYRVNASSVDISGLSADSPVVKWLNDSDSENDSNVILYGGIYLNPAESEVRQLVLDGVREIITKYDVDGIHFDDYFYPTTDVQFDSASYDKYTSSAQSALSLADWRRANVNSLISGCYTAIKHIDKNVLFSISPAASITNNYNELYADVENWVENGCVDYIIPQLYFGFEYPAEEFRFDVLLKDWKKLMECNTDVGLQIGLATYKIATDAEPDCQEWSVNEDIIAKQTEVCLKDSRVEGVVFFSYSSLFSDNTPNTVQRKNLKEIYSQ